MTSRVSVDQRSMNSIGLNELSNMDVLSETSVPTDKDGSDNYSVDQSSLRMSNLKNKFGDLSENEDIINDFSCALKKDILIQGRMYIGLESFYFLSNILGYVTKVNEQWSNVLTIEKAKLANIIPNAIRITTTDGKYTFASFRSRNYCYEVLKEAIKNNKDQSNLKASEIRENVKKAYNVKNDDTISVSNLNINDSNLSLNTIDNKKIVKDDLNLEPNIKKKKLKSTFYTTKSLRKTDETMATNSVLKPKLKRCECESFKNILFQKIFCVNIDQIFSAIYDDSCSMMKTIYENHKFQEFKVISREVQSDKSVIKKSSHILPNAFMGKTARTSIEEKFPSTNITNKHYQILSVSKSEGVPFSDTFEVHSNTCLTNLDDKRTSIKISMEVKFVKSGWTIPKDTIEKTTMKTFESVTKEMMSQLEVLFGAPLDIIENISLDQVSARKRSLSVAHDVFEKEETPRFKFKSSINFVLNIIMCLFIIYIVHKIYQQNELILSLQLRLSQCYSENRYIFHNTCSAFNNTSRGKF